VYFEPSEPPFETSAPLVLKIGGSLIRRSTRLKVVTRTVAQARRPLVIVCGGGALADSVRDAQRRLGFDDLTAHRMALFTLNQNGLMLASLMSGPRLGESIEEVAGALSAGETVMFLPFAACDRDPELPRSWEATSDAVAARLAERLGGIALAFLKSRAPEGPPEPSSLAEEGLIDPVSAEILERSDVPFTLIDLSDGAGAQSWALAQLVCVPQAVDVTRGP
jgi:5-(aminomethyl)-3-furanmethanol phosphate kinase